VQIQKSFCAICQCGEKKEYFFADTRDLTHGWHRPKVKLSKYVHFLVSLPFKEFSKYLYKKWLCFRGMVIGYAL
jgi:hypothetical protein